MNYTGVIIEESLANTSVLNGVTITEINVEPIPPKHNTPWLHQWTLHTVEIPEEKADAIAEKIALSIDTEYTS